MDSLDALLHLTTVWQQSCYGSKAAMAVKLLSISKMHVSIYFFHNQRDGARKIATAELCTAWS